MKYVLVIACVIGAVIAEQYTDKYDNIDLKEILENDRLLKGYMDCIMDRGKCTPEGKELKEHIQEAMENNCEKCTDKQRDGVVTVLDYLIKSAIDYWKELTEKYDPTGEYRKKYEEEAKKRGINIPKDE